MINRIDKLGIAVVYLISERNERLLDIHLERIERHTKADYRIYGSAVRLLPQFLPKLENHPKLTVCPCEPYVETGEQLRRYEHSWYLEQLVRFAFDDGCSHVMILHVDSFPVRDGWAQELAAKLSRTCVMAGIVRDKERDHKPMSAGILLDRRFYIEHSPRLLLTEAELASPEYARYKAEVPHSKDSGAGYGFAVHRLGLTFVPLLQSSAGDKYSHHGSLYEDMIFHLNAAMQMENSPDVAYRAHTFKRNAIRRTLGATAKLLLPANTREKLLAKLPLHLAKPERHHQRMSFEAQRELLLSDPDAYIEYLRNGIGRKRRTRVGGAR